VGGLLGLDPVPLPDGIAIPAEDWHQTPTSVRQHFLALLKRVEALEARVNRGSSNFSRPPSTDSRGTSQLALYTYPQWNPARRTSSRGRTQPDSG
jgi:hypothetical protein